VTSPPDPADISVLAGTLALAHLHTDHTYGDWTLAKVVSTLHAGGMVTQVTGGPLDDSEEITTQGHCREGLRTQHHKWVWRVLNADKTRAEWFARKARRTPKR
jgi:hypothetical protein